VADSGLDTILAVDLLSGDRKDLERFRIGAGERLGVVSDFDIDRASGQLLAGSGRNLFAIDPASGDRTVVASPAHGSGPVLENVRGVDVTSAERAFVVGDELDALVAVALATGDRTIIAGGTIGFGPPIEAGIVLGSQPDRFFSLSIASRGLLDVDLESGDRVVIPY
jgi:hypothetical protein